MRGDLRAQAVPSVPFQECFLKNSTLGACTLPKCIDPGFSGTRCHLCPTRVRVKQGGERRADERRLVRQLGILGCKLRRSAGGWSVTHEGSRTARTFIDLARVEGFKNELLREAVRSGPRDHQARKRLALLGAALLIEEEL